MDHTDDYPFDEDLENSSLVRRVSHQRRRRTYYTESPQSDLFDFSPLINGRNLRNPNSNTNTPIRSRVLATPTRSRLLATPTRSLVSATPTRSRVSATPTRSRVSATPNIRTPLSEIPNHSATNTQNAEGQEVNVEYGDWVINRVQETTLERQSGKDFIRNRAQQLQFVSQAFSMFLNATDNAPSQVRAIVDNYDSAMPHVQKNKYTTSIRIFVNINSFNAYPQLRSILKRRPHIGLPAFENAIAEVCKGVKELSKTSVTFTPQVAIYGYMHEEHITPRGLNASLLDRLSCIEGVINKCYVATPKVATAIYIGESDKSEFTGEKNVYVRHLWDVTNFDKSVKDLQPPPQKNPSSEIVYRFEAGLSEYKDRQRFVLQEAPETAPTGQMPRSIEIIAETDLVNTVKCGDRVRVWGVYRINLPKVEGNVSGIFKPYFIANNIANVNSALEGLKKLTASVEEKYMQVARMPNTLEVVSAAIAPSMFGHREIKMGLLLMLVGGRTIETSSHKIRGDIHIMLIGDPSCGKSQLLRYILNLVPGSVSATGRGSSGVGLTASVVTDNETGERRVEGGACVMGDRNIICIDEFDKMRPQDTIAIHEVMEQQTVTVSKAGIHTVLNARCSILAAANPVYGCWSDTQNLSSQVIFPQSLLSRFDLVFIVRDSSDEKSDDAIASQILKNLVNCCKGISRGAGGTYNTTGGYSRDGRIHVDVRGYEPVGIIDDTPADSQTEENMFGISDDSTTRILKTEYLRGYIKYCKNDFYHIKAATEGWEPYPVLTDGAHKSISKFYSQLRDICRTKFSNQGMLCFVTVRSLEAIIRLSTAHARLKLQRYVTSEDVRIAASVLNYTILGDAIDLYNDDESDSEAESSEECYSENITLHHNDPEERLKRRLRRDELRKSVEAEIISKKSRTETSFLHVHPDSQMNLSEMNDHSFAGTSSQETEASWNERVDTVFRVINRHCLVHKMLSFDNLMGLINRTQFSFCSQDVERALTELSTGSDPAISYDPESGSIYVP